jgi:hypothetical protein
MDFEARAEEFLQEIAGELNPPAPPSCMFADLLSSWADPLVADAEKRRDLALIMKTQLLLLKKFMEILSHTPPPHRYKMHPKGHICLWHRFKEFYDRLYLAEVSLTQPLFLPEPVPPPPPHVHIHGTLVGEIVDE